MELSEKTVRCTDRSRPSPVPAACLFANSPALLTSSSAWLVEAAISSQFRRQPCHGGHDEKCAYSAGDHRNNWTKKLATRPDSNAPSSFDVPIKREFSADTRPRVLSGVRTCTRVDRTTTLMLSQEPSRQSIAIESQKFREIPNTTVTVPKPATATNRVRPALLKGPRCA